MPTVGIVQNSVENIRNEQNVLTYSLESKLIGNRALTSMLRTSTRDRKT